MIEGKTPSSGLTRALFRYRLDRREVGQDGRSEGTGDRCGQAAQDLDFDLTCLTVVVDSMSTGIEKGPLGCRAEFGQAGQGFVQPH